MPIYHYHPVPNGVVNLGKDSLAGWYSVVIVRDSKLVEITRWWNGYEWNHGPNMRSSWKSLSDQVKGITRLVPE